MMDFTLVKNLTIPEGKVKQIMRKADGHILWNGGYKNWVRFSTESDGVTIYNGGKGYKDGYRVRSGGAEAEANNTSCTGFIPVQGGDVIRFCGWNLSGISSGNAVNVYSSGYENIGQTATNASYGIMADYNAYTLINSMVEESTGIWKWCLPPDDSGICYIRVSAYDGINGVPGTRMIVTVNEEITI